MSALTFYTENWPACTTYIVRVCGCALVSGHIYVCAYEHAPSPQIIKKKHCNQNATVITLHFSRRKKKGASLQKSICKRSYRTAQHFAVSFSFRTALRLSRLLPSSLSLSPHYLPAPSVFLQSNSHQTNRSCLAFQSSHSEQLSACHILSEFSPSFPGRGDRAPVESWPCRFSA